MTCNPDDSHRSSAIVAAAGARHEATQRRASEALHHLQTVGTPVTFVAVARAAAVSRSWLYRDPGVRAEIDRLRGAQPPASKGRVPAAERASAASVARLLEAARSEVAALREENHRLREVLARRSGERRLTQPGGDG